MAKLKIPTIPSVDEDAEKLGLSDAAGGETGRDLGPFATVLAPGQTPPPATKYKETIRD